MAYIIGVDVGTGSTKAVAIDAENNVLGVAQYHYPTFSPASGYSEQDPEMIWQAFKSAIFDLHTELGVPEAIGLSGVMHSLFAVDAQGEALAPMLTWADSRSAMLAEKTRATNLGKTLYEETGTPIYGMSPLFKIMWIRENQPALYANTFKFISIKEYIWYRLFGEFKIDHSIASATGLFNISTLNWHSDALNLAQIDKSRLSEPVPTDYVRSGASLIDEGLLAFSHAKFVIGASDGCLANLGSGATEPGIAAVTIGTSGAVRIASKQPVLNNGAMTFNYILNSETYICGGAVNNGGLALQWLLGNVFGREHLTDDDYEELFNGVEHISPGSDGLLFLPYLTGERAPLWDAERCGTFFGLRNDHQQSHLLNAVLEGICYALNDVLLAVEEQGSSVQQLNVSGGFVKSRVWMQVLADITGKTVFKKQLEDASAIGAATLAAMAVGLAGFDNNQESGEPILSDISRYEVYCKYFKLYREVSNDLSGAMHKLYQLRHF
ncbi:gluconokinase [Pedobacter sp. PWIIR3]